MANERIDFISSYCDRWCARCAFTSRCSTFAVEAAISMCGATADAFELALGDPPAEQPADPPRGPHGWIVDEPAEGMSPEEEADWMRRARERDRRVEETPIMRIAWPYARLAHDWLHQHSGTLQRSDPVVAEALAVAAHDASFITVKLHRALDGLDRHRTGEDPDEDPIQSDWNGTAKVVLISIERSEAAWRALTCGDDTPAVLADQLLCLRALVEAEFPDANRFVRPGFDDTTPEAA